MSKILLGKEDGFTPVIDSLVIKYDVTTALVFGSVLRYCQMEKGVCNAAQEKIAKRIGMSIKTVERHLKTLVKDGYLIDYTPDLKNNPHTYGDTGKAHYATSESRTATSESRSGYVRESEPATSESPMKIVLREEEERIKKPENSSFEEQEQIQELNQLQVQKLFPSKGNDLIPEAKSISKTEEQAAALADPPATILRWLADHPRRTRDGMGRLLEV